MTVKDFIPYDDAKKTVEKLVKQKPTLKELTTVESPGKPVPQKLEAQKTKKKKRARKKQTSEKVKITKPIKDSILIITEKPQAAAKIAQALGNPKKLTPLGNVSYYEVKRDGKTILVASAVGHLFGLNYVKGQRGYPIFKIEWRPAFEKKSAAFTKRYYDVLKRLAQKAETAIIATDYDVEGEVIGWNVLRFICGKETAQRMKYSTLTKNELENSYNNLLKEPDWGQAYAGETRHILDWLYGINLSRALMTAIKTTGSFKIISIGRVQGPALKIIVDREREIAKFKPEPFWRVSALVKNNEKTEKDAGLPNILGAKGGVAERAGLSPKAKFSGDTQARETQNQKILESEELKGDSPQEEFHEFTHPKDIFDEKELEKFKNIEEGTAETKESEEKIIPQTPFDLTTLQREAYRLHRMSPSQTLATAQKLYIDGVISYPRTSSQKIPDSIQPKSILKELKKQFPEFVAKATRPKPIEGKKSDPAHPSIYPTGEIPNKISETEQKLYNIIARRFISVFCPDATTENRRVKILGNDNPKLNFTSSGLKIKNPGWTAVYPTKLEEKFVPTLNGKIKIDKIKFEEKETQPPRRYTPTSLITTLEKKNLGTKATRSTIVDTLFDRGYLDGRSIKATPLGIHLIESLEKYSPIIIDENLTKSMEEEMENILEAKSEFKEKEDKIIQKAEKIITDISKEFKANETKIGKEILKGIEKFREEQQESNTIRECPTCRKGNLRIMYSKKNRSYFIACSAYPNCTQTYSVPKDALIKKAEKDCEYCGWPKILSIKKGKKPWEICFNTECEEVKRRIKEWQDRKAKYKS